MKTILVSFFVGLASTASFYVPEGEGFWYIPALLFFYVHPGLVLLTLVGLFLMLCVNYAGVRRLRNRDSALLEEEDPHYHVLYRVQLYLGWAVFVGLGGGLGMSVGLQWIGWLIVWSGGIGH